MKKNATIGAASSGRPTITVSRDAKVTKQKLVPRKSNKVSSKMAQEGVGCVDSNSNERLGEQIEQEEQEEEEEEEGKGRGEGN